MAFPEQTFPNLEAVRTYVNTNIIPNGMNLINGTENNNVLNALITFIEQSPLNYTKADIVSTTGTYAAVNGCTIFMTSVPSSFAWGDNIYNEWVFINTTSSTIPLISGLVWYDINLTENSFVPAKERLHIIKAANGMWIQASDFGSSVTPPPIVTGPASQSVNIGDDATFTITVSSSLPYTIQWYLNGTAITGATLASYVKTDCQLSDSGGVYYAIVTSTAGDTQSQNATLTVATIITGFLYYSPNDPGPTLQGGSDPFTYQNSYNITHNQPIVITLPGAATEAQFLVCKIPSTESAKTAWVNDQFNSGAIPGPIFQTPTTFGGFTYYYTRLQTSLNPASPLTLS